MAMAKQNSGRCFVPSFKLAKWIALPGRGNVSPLPRRAFILERNSPHQDTTWFTCFGPFRGEASNLGRKPHKGAKANLSEWLKGVI